MRITCKVTIDLYFLDEIYSRDLGLYEYRHYCEEKDYKMKFIMKIIPINKKCEQVYDVLVEKEIEDNRKGEVHYLSFQNITYIFNNKTLELLSQTLEHKI